MIVLALIAQLAHPDIPAGKMCDPMPTFVWVCHYDPKAQLAGVECPPGYVRILKTVPGKCQ